MFKVWATVDIHLPLRDVADVARRAEAMGFDRIAIPDNVHDGLVAAAIAIQATRRIEIATSALVCFARSPMTTAVAAWDLQALSSGRFRLGLGPLVAPIILQKYSSPWSPPAPRMREYIQSLRAIFDCWQYGKPLDFRGTHYTFTRQQDFVRPPPIEHPDIPIHLAAIGPHMTALAGERAQGLMTHPTNSSPRYIQEVMRGNIDRGAQRTGRSGRDVALTVAPLCATGATRAAVLAQREKHRELLAILYSTPNYWPNLDLCGWGDRGALLKRLAKENRWSEMAPLITDEILDTMVPAAPYQELAGVLLERYRGLADAIALAMPKNPADDAALIPVIETLQGA